MLTSELTTYTSLTFTYLELESGKVSLVRFQVGGTTRLQDWFKHLEGVLDFSRISNDIVVQFNKIFECSNDCCNRVIFPGCYGRVFFTKSTENLAYYISYLCLECSVDRARRNTSSSHPIVAYEEQCDSICKVRHLTRNLLL